MRIAEGRVPAKLLDQQVYLLDMTAMVAGTQFRGQFENRMKGVVEDARNSGDVILVIDELHNIMGAGDAEGAMNAANILKPALAKGEIRVIGSTTLDEYRRFIEKDSALERRFQKVIVEEPSIEDSIKILCGIRDYYEQHHHVTYSDEVLEAAVRLSQRYITERFLPDKAIDLIDEAGSNVNLNDEVLVDLQRKQQAHSDVKIAQDQLEKKLARAGSEEERLSLYEKQAELLATRKRIEGELMDLEQRCKPVPVSVDDIARVVELWTGIPVQQITESESTKLMNLEERLHQRVIGQCEAVSAVSRAIRRHRAGFGKKGKPASFIFVGPTGVGKTELVKAVAEVMFNSEDALIRLDMSEFMEAHTISKLIGSPPGYVGYDDAASSRKDQAQVTTIVLLMSLKSTRRCFNILLQILDEGRLTDSHTYVSLKIRLSLYKQRRYNA